MSSLAASVETALGVMRGGTTADKAEVSEVRRDVTARAGDGLSSKGSGPRVRVVVPVTVELDGMVLARAQAEYEVEMGEERAYNASSAPLRGVES